MQQSGGLLPDGAGRIGTSISSFLRKEEMQTSLVTRSRKETAFVVRQRRFLFDEINPFGICEMFFVREIWLCHVKCVSLVDLFHFTFCVAENFIMTVRSLFHIRGIFH